jgi:hypothetical protein
MSHEEEKDGAFKVVDKRRFDEAGDVRDDAPEQAAPAEPASPAEAMQGADISADAPSGGKQGVPPKIDFPTFCLSLASSAQVALGLVDNPVTQKKEKMLPAAQQTIDILVMMHEKTKGNLTGDEDKLLEELLYTLRMQYVEASK